MTGRSPRLEDKGQRGLPHKTGRGVLRAFPLARTLRVNDEE